MSLIPPPSPLQVQQRPNPAVFAMQAPRFLAVPFARWPNSGKRRSTKPGIGRRHIGGNTFNQFAYWANSGRGPFMRAACARVHHPSKSEEELF
jgi:hypothetical protein